MGPDRRHFARRPMQPGHARSRNSTYAIPIGSAYWEPCLPRCSRPLLFRGRLGLEPGEHGRCGLFFRKAPRNGGWGRPQGARLEAESGRVYRPRVAGQARRGRPEGWQSGLMHPP